jgi:scyllo-inositol 2-dehydrogenase (NADP+)
VARDPNARAEAVAVWGTRGFADLDEALAEPSVDLVVIATPHDTHAELAIRSLEAGKACVVDKVMALTTAEADRMIAARNASGRMLSVFHNRRWDWDYLTVKAILAEGRIGRPCSSRARSVATPPRAPGGARRPRPGRSCTTGGPTWSTRR